MKNLLIIIVLIALYSCNNHKENKNAVIERNTDSLQTELIDNSNEFLNLFRNIEPKNLHVYTIERDKEGEIISSLFEGVSIDVRMYSYVNDENIFINIQACKEGYSNLFAIGKFDINDKYWGLIIRQRSQYDESLIQLMFWDKNQKKIVYAYDLADSFGDAGWYFDKESWIKEFEYNKKLIIIIRQKDYIPDEETSTVTITDSLKINHFNGSVFVTKDLNLKDTVYYKLKRWE